jgi:hypothetical protein
MPLAIPDGLTPEYVPLALAEPDRGVEYPFGSPTGDELVHDGRRHLAGRIPRPKDFLPGDAPRRG